MTDQTPTPVSYLENVVDEKTFLRFLQLLALDWHKAQAIESPNTPSPFRSGNLGWENGDIGQFLESAAACGLGRLPNGEPESRTNPWKRAASIIYAGKIYE